MPTCATCTVQAKTHDLSCLPPSGSVSNSVNNGLASLQLLQLTRFQCAVQGMSYEEVSPASVPEYSIHYTRRFGFHTENGPAGMQLFDNFHISGRHPRPYQPCRPPLQYLYWAVPILCDYNQPANGRPPNTSQACTHINTPTMPFSEHTSFTQSKWTA